MPHIQCTFQKKKVNGTSLHVLNLSIKIERSDAWYFDHRIVRLTSPNLNYCIIAGALLLYGSAFIRLPFTNDLLVWDIFCKVSTIFYVMFLSQLHTKRHQSASVLHLLYLQIESIMNCIGYSFMFGPILAKMWRIYYIFHNPSPQKKVRKCTMIAYPYNW